MADYLERQLGVPVSLLHGDMADTQEHRKRLRRFNGNVAEEDRRAMMERFRKNSPAIMVATNLIGSGLDIPLANLIVITDSDAFGEAEIQATVGRVGRRERPSDAGDAGRTRPSSCETSRLMREAARGCRTGAW